MKNEEDIKKWAQIDIQTRKLSDARPMENFPLVPERKSSQGSSGNEKIIVVEEKKEMVITEPETIKVQSHSHTLLRYAAR